MSFAVSRLPRRRFAFDIIGKNIGANRRKCTGWMESEKWFWYPGSRKNEGCEGERSDEEGKRASEGKKNTHKGTTEWKLMETRYKQCNTTRMSEWDVWSWEQVMIYASMEKRKITKGIFKNGVEETMDDPRDPLVFTTFLHRVQSIFRCFPKRMERNLEADFLGFRV